MWWRNRKKLDAKPLEETTQLEDEAGTIPLADQDLIDVCHAVINRSRSLDMEELASATGPTIDSPKHEWKLLSLKHRQRQEILHISQAGDHHSQNKPQSLSSFVSVKTETIARARYFSPGQYAPANTPDRSFPARPSPRFQPDTRPLPIRQQTGHLKPLNQMTVKSDSIPSLIRKPPSPSDTPRIQQRDTIEGRSATPSETHLDIEAPAAQQPDQRSLVEVPPFHIYEPTCDPAVRSDMPLPDWLDQAAVVLGKQAGLPDWAQQWLRDLVALWPAIGYHAVRQHIRDDLNLDTVTKTAMQRVVDRLKDLTTKN